MKRVIQTAAAIALLACQAVAGPDATTQMFLDQPVSVLEWGMFKLKSNLEFILFSAPYTDERSTSVNVVYTWNDDTINVIVHDAVFGDDDYYTDERTMLLCKDLLNRVRFSAGVYEDGLVSPGVGDYSLFARNFIFYELQTSGSSEALQELDAKFVILAGFNKSQCRGHLLSNEITVIE
ncbi:MAG: hypothetical protein HRU33_27135 [Rhodobacteraceae bacterium]|nr:hypothetical protein [Paracoccaceae bacterium]